MTPERLLELQRLASETNSATLHTLLDHWRHSDMPFEEWAYQAIVLLTRQNAVLLAAAVDAEMRASPKPFLAERKPFITERQ